MAQKANTTSMHKKGRAIEGKIEIVFEALKQEVYSEQHW
jgi:hypothetical protein